MMFFLEIVVMLKKREGKPLFFEFGVGLVSFV